MYMEILGNIHYIMIVFQQKGNPSMQLKLTTPQKNAIKLFKFNYHRNNEDNNIIIESFVAFLLYPHG